MLSRKCALCKRSRKKNATIPGNPTRASGIRIPCKAHAVNSQTSMRHAQVMRTLPHGRVLGKHDERAAQDVAREGQQLLHAFGAVVEQGSYVVWRMAGGSNRVKR